MTTPTLLQRRNRLLGTGTPLFYDDPVTLVRGEGVWLFDDRGQRFLDLYNNVPCVGHCHPHVVEALHRQAQTLNVHSRYLHEGVLDYAERLTGLHGPGLESVVFTCTGTEANEVALAIARAVTGGQGIICTDAAYHGNSAEVSKLTRVRLQPPDQRDPHVRAVPFPQRLRPLADNLSPEALADAYLAAVEEAIAGFRADGIPLAGMIVCSILANEGLPDIPAGYMRRAAELVRAAGGLFIADEVQAGFCRTGHWWGYQAEGFTPDIVSLGKPMGNGLPVAGVVASRQLMDTFRQRRRYFNTFAGSPLQAAVGMAVIDVIEQEELGHSAAQVGGYLQAEITKRQADCPQMADVRGQGLFLGMEWVTDRASNNPDPAGAAAVVDRLRHKGFLIGAAGVHNNVLKVRPPLVFQREHADLFLTALDEALGEVQEG